MKAPKCRLCEKHHYGACDTGHVPKETQMKKKTRAKRADPRVAEPKSMTIEQRLDDIEDRLNKLESRKKYMKKYMADRRAT